MIIDRYVNNKNAPETLLRERMRTYFLKFDNPAANQRLIRRFSRPDYTVGFGISPNRAHCARGLYRRSGISPCPEVIDFYFTHLILALRPTLVNTVDLKRSAKAAPRYSAGVSSGTTSSSPVDSISALA